MTGGAEDDFERLLKHYSNLKDKYELYCLIPNGPRAEKYSDYCNETYYYRVGWFPLLYSGLINYIKFFIKFFIQYGNIKKIINNHGIDIVVFNVSVLIWPVLIFSRKKIISIVFIRETIKPDFLRKFIFKYLYKRVDYFIAVSKSNAIDYIEKTKKNNICTVFSSIEFKEYQATLTTRNDIEEINGYDISETFNTKSIKILNIGPICKIKNQDLIIEALNVLKTNNSDFSFTFYNIGFINKKDKYVVKLMNKVIKYGLAEKCIFLNELDRLIVYDIMKNIDVVIISSINEGFPLVIPEAFMMKIPLISTKVGGVCDILTDSHNSILIDRNPNLLAEAILRLSSDAEFRNKLINNAHNDFLKIFIFENNIEIIDNIIDECIKKI
jgi:L-malate glycosyltransferase